MALEVTNLDRKFIFGKEVLADPNPDFTPAEVLKFHSAQHEELTTATINGPEIKGDTAEYKFSTTVGTKG